MTIFYIWQVVNPARSSRSTKWITNGTGIHCSNLILILEQTHPFFVQFQSPQTVQQSWPTTAGCDCLASYTVRLNKVWMNPVGQKNASKIQNNEIIHPESTQKQPYTSNWKPLHLQCSKHYCCRLRCGSPPFGLMVSPQLVPSRLSSRVKSGEISCLSQRIDSALNGEGACNLETRVVSGTVLFSYI